ncbi:MAG: hypothetical protein KJ626_10700 [Verrucomicrobia bacterium]|nr:hypothetical protein [Verrucomicrobiota bacterium]
MRTFCLLAVCTVLALSASADLIGTYKTITLDGSLSDWNAADTLYNDAEIGDGSPANSSYENIYAANDGISLYLGLDTKVTGGGDINNDWTRNIYMDTDVNSGTGFNAGWMSHGYDRLVQYGAGGGSYSVFEFNGATQADWGWNWLGLIAYSYSDDIAELAVPISNWASPATLR